MTDEWEVPPNAEWRSPLEKRPDYVRAIGMVSIENANLEMALADLLAAVVHVRREVGRAIFFAPRGAMVRLDILAEAATATLRPKRDGDKFYENKTTKAEALKKILAIIKRARSAINRRHEVIHEAWGVEPSTGEVIGSRLPWQNPGTSRSLTMLNNLIRE